MSVHISTILHLADIHINAVRHCTQEYLEFIANVNLIPRDLLVICGDVFHNNTITPDDICIFNNMIKVWAETPIVLIAGNHDIIDRTGKCNLHALLSNLPSTEFAAGSKFGNVYYATKSVPFVVGNILFHPMCLQDFDPQTYKIDTSPDYTNIALVHNRLYGSVYPNPHMLPIYNTSFDMVYAGDVHTRTFITPTVAYPGSPYQLNFGEINRDKGGILWDIATRTGRAINIPSRYGFIKRIGGVVVSGDIPEISYGTSDDEFVSAHIDGEILARALLCGDMVCATTRPFTIEHIAFDNVRCYGVNNHVTFENRAMVISEDNGTGKTSLVYVLCVALFGRPPYGTLTQMTNSNKTALMVECGFDSHGEKHVIRRTYTNGKIARCSLSVNGATIGGTSAAEINAHIIARIGDMPQFLSINALINPRDDFMQMTAREQTDLIMSMYGFSYDAVYKHITATQKKLKATMNTKPFVDLSCIDTEIAILRADTSTPATHLATQTRLAVLLDRRARMVAKNTRREFRLKDQQNAEFENRVLDARLSLVQVAPLKFLDRFIRDANIPGVVFANEHGRLSATIRIGTHAAHTNTTSGFEQVLVSVATRLAFARVFGRRFMFIDDCCDRICKSNLAGFREQISHVDYPLLYITHIDGCVLPRVHIGGDPVCGGANIMHGGAVVHPNTECTNIGVTPKSDIIWFGDIAAYQKIGNKYMCLRCTSRVIVPSIHSLHNRKHD